MRLRRVHGHDPAGAGGLAARRRGVRIDPRSDVAALVERQFERHDHKRPAHVAAFTAALKPSEDRLMALQSDGHPMQWTDQVFIEAKWLLHYTTDWGRLDRDLGRLSESFERPDQEAAVRQSPADGAWGQAYTEWFLKLDASIDGLNELADAGGDAAYPLSFLAPVATTDGMEATLDALRCSDIVATGLDNRDAFGSLTTFLSEVLFKKGLRACIGQHTTGFTITDAMVDSYRAWQDGWQDPETGFWGAWYRDGRRTVKAPDLSFTFHTVSYRRGKVELWPRIIDTLLGMKDAGYPYGWKSNGRYLNHNNYDVVKILGYGWAAADDAQRTAACAAIGELLDWCLTCSLQPDGSFAIDPDAYSSVADAFYYGVVFLDVCGYWDKTKRFWTDRDFPDARAKAALIAGRIQTLGLTEESAKAALAIVESVAS